MDFKWERKPGTRWDDIASQASDPLWDLEAAACRLGGPITVSLSFAAYVALLSHPEVRRRHVEQFAHPAKPVPRIDLDSVMDMAIGLAGFDRDLEQKEDVICARGDKRLVMQVLDHTNTERYG